MANFVFAARGPDAYLHSLCAEKQMPAYLVRIPPRSLTLQSGPRFFPYTYSRFSFRLRIRSLTTWKIAICTAKYTNAVPKTVWTICR